MFGKGLERFLLLAGLVTFLVACVLPNWLWTDQTVSKSTPTIKGEGK